jgi:hypothetical protein
MYRNGVYNPSFQSERQHYGGQKAGERSTAGYEYVAPGIIEGEPGRRNSGVPRHDNRSEKRAWSPRQEDDIHEHAVEEENVREKSTQGRRRELTRRLTASRKDTSRENT